MNYSIVKLTGMDLFDTKHSLYYSSFDEYVTEVKSGRLEWSPVHKEIRFWRENAARLNEGNYELLRYIEISVDIASCKSSI